MRISSIISNLALLLTAVFLSCCVGAAADDDPSTSPSSTASPVLLSKGDKTPTPSEVPSMDPSALPSKDPSAVPSINPSETPTISPSESPSSDPSLSINPSDSPTTSPSSSMSPTRDFEQVDGYKFIDNGYCLDADGHKYNSISVFDKFTGKSSECGEGCGGCFWNIPEYVGFNYFFMEDPETGELSNKCSCLFESGIAKKEVEDSTTCSFTDDAFDFNNGGQGEIVAGDSTDEKRDHRTCYARQSVDPSELPTTSPSSSLSPTTEAEKFIKIFNHTGTVQHYTIPEDDYYTFTAVGAKGGDCDGCDKATCSKEGEWCYKCDAQFHEGGYGTLVRGTFYLHKGDQIEVLVGGRGGDCRKIRKYDDFSSDKHPLDFDRDYLEAVTGAGGGGGTSVRVKYAADGKEDLLLIAGGGGGAAKFHHGEDGELRRNGGWEWGGKNGQGGGLANAVFGFGIHGGAAGGGYYSNGASRSVSGTSIVVAKGGDSLSDGAGHGGFVDFSDDSSMSGGAGGFGSGAQGGFGQCGENDSGPYEFNGGGGGGGGYSGGGAGPGGGNGAGGGGSFGPPNREGHIGDDDGYVMMESQAVDGYKFIGTGYCLDADGREYNSISFFDKFTGKPGECGEGCDCFQNIPQYVGFNYFVMVDPETDVTSNKCSCLFESGITREEVEDSTTCSFSDDAFDFNQSGQGEIVASASDSTDEERDYRTCYANQVTRFDYVGPMFQYYEIKEDALFRITALGAQGGNCYGGGYPYEVRTDKNTYGYQVDGAAPEEWHHGGYGALAQGKFFLKKGDVLRIVVGEQGQNCDCLGYILDEGDYANNNVISLKTCSGAGGGGASYVQIKREVCTPLPPLGEICNDIYSLLVLGGAGGGANQLADGLDGQATEDGGGVTYHVCQKDSAYGFGQDLCAFRQCTNSGGCENKSFGGENGGGGQLGPQRTYCETYIHRSTMSTGDGGFSIGGGGGGGVSSAGGTRCCKKDGTNLGEPEPEENCNDSNDVAKGGGQISPLDALPYGGYVFRHSDNDDYLMWSGSAGGFGGGGQGGPRWYGRKTKSNHCKFGLTHGAGAGGGGGYGGGAPGAIGGGERNENDLPEGKGGSGGGGGSFPSSDTDFAFDTLTVAGAGKDGSHGYVKFEIIQSIGVGLPGVGGPGDPGVGGPPGESKAGKRPKSSSQTSKSDVGDSAKRKKKGKREREEVDSLFA